jgi:hypothetical protein
VGAGVLGCACCAPPVIGFLAAASVATVIGVVALGATGLAIAVLAAFAYLRRRRTRGASPSPTPVLLGRRGRDA